MEIIEINLTLREAKVLTMLAMGKMTKEISVYLGTSTSTVDKQIRSARKKLNARNNEQAVVTALQTKIIKI